MSLIMLTSPTQSETSARRFLVNRMGSQAGRFLLPRGTGSLICRYPSISKSGKILPWGRDEKAQQSVEQSHRSAARGAKFRNCTGRHARHPGLLEGTTSSRRKSGDMDIFLRSARYAAIVSRSFLSKPMELTLTAPSVSIRKIVGTLVRPVVVETT